jgi:hypothetical protein
MNLKTLQPVQKDIEIETEEVVAHNHIHVSLVKLGDEPAEECPLVAVQCLGCDSFALLVGFVELMCVCVCECVNKI